MTHNWQDMTDEEITRALAEKVLRWEVIHHTEKSDNFLQRLGSFERGIGIILPDGRMIANYADKLGATFAPLEDRNDTFLLWDALSDEQKNKVAMSFVRECALGEPREMGDKFLDPLKLSQAIFTVMVEE
jgi:hypothetical protein